MEVVTLREFARRIGVSLTAIQKGVKTGRIQAITDSATGKITGIDFESQAPAWSANSKHPQKRPHNISGGRPRNDGQAPAKPQSVGGDRLPGRPSPAKGDAPPPTGQMTMAEVQRAREIVKLQIDNLKLREAQGELVSAAEVKKQGHALAAGIISSLYNIPDRCADEIAGMSDPHAIHKLLLTEIDNAVEAIRKQYG
jgi:hypothetical protein